MREELTTIQMSPGFAAGIFGFLFVHVVEHRVGGLVEELCFVPLIQFTETTADGGALVVRQLGQFGKDFNRTHGRKLTLPREAGKRGFKAQFQPGKSAPAGICARMNLACLAGEFAKFLPRMKRKLVSTTKVVSNILAGVSRL